MIPVLDQPILHRLGLALLHSLWELALIGTLAWTTLALLRKSSARARYKVALLFLAAMAVAPFATFWLLGSESGLELSVAMRGIMAAVTESEGRGGSWKAQLQVVHRALLPWYGLAWIVGFAAMLLRFCGGILLLNRTCLRDSFPAPEAWQARMNALLQGRRRQPRLALSRWAETPMVFGWLRPVILFPASAFLHLSPEAFEAILAHELAHILRRDYLANLLQTCIDSFLFYHPAAWWLSRQVRELREHCCDDAAVALAGHPLALAEGLATLSLLRRPASTEPEMALAAAKGPVMSRIHRLLQPKDFPLPSLGGLFVSLGLMASLAAATTVAQEGKPASPPKKVAAEETGSTQKVDFGKVKVVHQPPPPAYPAQAKEQKIQGTVVVELIVDKTGMPIKVEALEGPAELRETAENYARKWRFAPVKQKGKPVQVSFKLTMPFRLR
jgi:bla regulator protein BlaR1